MTAPVRPPADRRERAPGITEACLFMLVVCGCRGAPTAGAEPLAAQAADPKQRLPASSRPVVLDIARSLDSCALGHRGVLLDLGDASMRQNLHPGSLAYGPDEWTEHDGATWLRVRSRSVAATFYWPAFAGEASDATVYVEARVRGMAARAASVTIDGKAVGAFALAKGETRIVLARGGTPVSLAPGGHDLALRFIGGSRVGEEPLAEIDWVHVGVGEQGEPYAAPTRSDVAVDATLEGRSIRALSLRAPSFVRCSGWVPSNATLEVTLGSAGGGDADVEARLLRDRRAPVVLGAAHVIGAGVWSPWSVPITGLEGDGALASVELVVKRATKGTRVLLGEPQVVAAGSIARVEQAPVRGVVLVVLGSTASKALAPWGGSHSVPELTRLASTGTTFLANRATSSLANAVVASMLTGLPPIVHRLDDPDARLPEALTTVPEACRQGGIATAMFTANPTTGGPFGFARGWDAFVSRDPLEDAPATRVFDDAAAWIDAHRASKFLVVVHARGGHPPWDASPEELKSMPPDGYLGMLEPRRAAEALTKARKHPGRFREDDRVRAWALYDRAVDAHDEALGRLLAALRLAGRESDTAVMVTGDVAASEAPPVPFAEPDSLDEPLLATPLVIRWPQAAALAGRRIEAPSGPADLARTVLLGLGLSPPAAFEGADLQSIASGSVVSTQRPLAAMRGGRFSVRWGTYVLSGARQREMRMCDLSLDPACIADVRATSPLALEAMRRWTIEALAASPPPGVTRTAAVLDERSAAALVRWGRPTDESETDER